MQAFNILTNQEEEIDPIKVLTKSDDFIASMPHAGIYIPLEIKNKINFTRGLQISSDLHTDKVYSTKKGTEVIFNINTAVINPSRLRNGSTDKSLPLHLQNDPFSGNSLTEDPLRKMDFLKEEKQFLIKYYDQYHESLENEIEKMKSSRGYALVFECHSMNSVGLKNTPDEGKLRPDFTIGTLNDMSADKEIIQFFQSSLKKESNLTVTKNDLYKGGYLTQKYGNPKNNIHVIQLEIKRCLFMDESLEKGNFEYINKNKITPILEKVFNLTAEFTKNLLKDRT
jgi:N-formylglutamate deformylase